MRARTGQFLLRLLVGFLLAPSRSAEGVTIDWVTVGDPGNAGDTAVMSDETTGYGSVPYAYRISKYEVTNAQYAEFLNAVALEHAAELYNPEMSSSPYGGISQNGSPGSFSYSVKPGFELKPVNFVSIVDAAYFANWLNNGQPVETPNDPPQSTIRLGAYDFPDAGLSRNPDAAVFVPSENEWYKAAYYDASSASYFDFPTSSNEFDPPNCTGPTSAANSANCYDGQGPVGDLVPVGSYPGSPSPYGTFDQGGNALEWTETMHFGSSSVARGGVFVQGYGYMVSEFRDHFPDDIEDYGIGFRVAAVIPEPGTGLLLMFGLVGFARRRRFLG